MGGILRYSSSMSQLRTHRPAAVPWMACHVRAGRALGPAMLLGAGILAMPESAPVLTMLGRDGEARDKLMLCFNSPP